jgi:putative ribosome biogenesis GTPase RsgA
MSWYEKLAVGLLEAAQEQGYLDRLLASFRRKHRILVLGSTGVGKSNLVASLKRQAPRVIDRLERTEFAIRHESIRIR